MPFVSDFFKKFRENLSTVLKNDNTEPVVAGMKISRKKKNTIKKKKNRKDRTKKK